MYVKNMFIENKNFFFTYKNDKKKKNVCKNMVIFMKDLYKR